MINQLFKNSIAVSFMPRSYRGDDYDISDRIYSFSLNTQMKNYYDCESLK